MRFVVVTLTFFFLLCCILLPFWLYMSVDLLTVIYPIVTECVWLSLICLFSFHITLFSFVASLFLFPSLALWPKKIHTLLHGFKWNRLYRLLRRKKKYRIKRCYHTTNFGSLNIKWNLSKVFIYYFGDVVVVVKLIYINKFSEHPFNLLAFLFAVLIFAKVKINGRNPEKGREWTTA